MRIQLLTIMALAGSWIHVSAQTANDYKINSLPGIDINTLNFEQYAGHIEINSKTNANIFFWMIEREIKTEPEKLIIWLNGGPGCSSMDGLFLENGPFRVNKNLSLTINEGGWQNYATNIYVDQPVGTGFSFANTDSYTHNLEQVTSDFVLFVNQLFTVFPQLKQQDMYIAGESYAGSYIPYFASRLISLNHQQQQEDKYRLKGIAIGNGWISSEHQYNAYYDYSMKYNLIPQDRAALVSSHLKTCQNDVKQKETIHVASCEKILTDIVDASTHEDSKSGGIKCMNMYDIRMTEEDHPECGLSWPYELSDVTRYLRQVDVKKAVHAEKQILGWKECTSLVSLELKDDSSKPSYYLLPDILKEVPVLLFSGEYDLICNYIGTEYLIGNMTWNGHRGFSKGTKRQEWKIDHQLAGYYMQERNLTYVLIKDGSHMVPYDRPIECLDMINRFMHVGNNQVKGKQSQVMGDSVVPSAPRVSETRTTASATATSSSPTAFQTTDTSQQQQQEERATFNSWGYTSVAMILFLGLGICCCCFRRGRTLSASAADEFGGAPQRQREDLKQPNKWLAWIQQLVKTGSANRKFRLGDRDETNELDELVVETPTLFEAEASDNEETSTALNRSTNEHFAIDNDETDDDFDDFADFDHGEGLTNKRK